MSMVVELEFVDEEGFDCTREVRVPSKFEVCWRCEGKGAHDAWEGGMTSDEMYEQGDDFIDDYLEGVYDVSCSVCHGQRVLEAVDEGRLPAELKPLWEQTKQAAQERQQELDWEHRMRSYHGEW